MKMSLILDSNYLLYKNVFTLVKLKTLYGDLPNALLNNFKKFNSLCRFEGVYLVSDSSASWRKQVYAEYKATRKKDERVDFDFVFEVYKEYKEHIAATTRCHVLEGESIEGDDWINLLIRKNNALGIGCVTVSGDQDFNQRLAYKLDPLLINVQVEDYTTYERIVLPAGYEMFLDRMMAESAAKYDVFTLPDENGADRMLETMLQHWRVKEVNPNKSLFCKLISGDTSDNIKSIFETPQNLKKGGQRMIGIGDATAELMWQHYLGQTGGVEAFSPTDDDFRARVVTALAAVKKLELGPEERLGVIDKLNFNTRLIELHHKHLPKPVLETMVARLKEVF